MLTRHLLPFVRSALADTPVVLLHGARQTGKTTLAKAIAGGRPGRRYFTMDDATVLAAASADPAGFVAGLEGPVVLDEVQRVPGLFPAIKAEVDRRREPGRFLLTGSANVLLLPSISESLAGRVEILTLWPCSQGEIGGVRETFIDDVFKERRSLPISDARSPALLDRIVRGGFPEPLGRDSSERRAAWFASYLTTILQRDVREFSNIEGLTQVPRLLALLAARTAGLLNYADLSRGMAMPQSTLKRYFALMETTFLIRTVPAWSGNLGLRLTKSPKTYLADTGLAMHLLGLDRGRLASDGVMKGALLENFVGMELIKQSGWSRTHPRLHHFRSASGVEVDMVLEDAAGRVVGIEVKSSTSVKGSDFTGLRTLRDVAKGKFVRGVVLYDGKQTVPFGPGLSAAPIASLWNGRAAMAK